MSFSSPLKWYNAEKTNGVWVSSSKQPSIDMKRKALLIVMTLLMSHRHPQRHGGDAYVRCHKDMHAGCDRHTGHWHSKYKQHTYETQTDSPAEPSFRHAHAHWLKVSAQFGGLERNYLRWAMASRSSKEQPRERRLRYEEMYPKGYDTERAIMPAWARLAPTEPDTPGEALYGSAVGAGAAQKRDKETIGSSDEEEWARPMIEARETCKWCEPYNYKIDALTAHCTCFDWTTRTSGSFRAGGHYTTQSIP